MHTRISSLIIITLVASALVSAPSIGWTAGKLNPKEVLTLKNGRFYLRGKPFAEISFNKFDLFWGLYDLLHQGKGDTPEYTKLVVSQDQALHELHEMGFKSIRFFGLPWGIWDFKDVYPYPEKRAKVFYRAMDTVLDLCDKNDIKVVYSLSAGIFIDTTLGADKLVYGEEHMQDLMANPNSRNRKLLNEYIDDVVTRYKNRKTILMWEISNELTLSADISPDTHVFDGQRMPTLQNVADFLDSVAKRIKANDKVHLVNSGGSSMRNCQWNQFTKHAWIRDTVEEQYKAMKLLYGNSSIDVIDIHYYPGNLWGDKVVGEDGKDVSMGIRRYLDIANRLKKPLYIGEFGLMPVPKDYKPESKKVWQETPDYFESYQDEAALKWVKRLMNEVVEAGAPIVHFWEYSSDRPGDQDRGSFDLKKGKTDPVLKLIIDANKRLKAKLGAE